MIKMWAKEITAIGNALGLEGTFLGEFGFNQIMAILAPEPEMETVLVERYECAWCGNVEATADAVICCANHNPKTAIKLTGTFLRAKTVPVERSIKVSLWPDGTYGCIDGVITESPTTGVFTYID